MLIVDYREPKEIKDYLSNKNIHFCIQHLIIGDYIVNGWYIERKSLNDFFTSYQSGRLFTQMLQLAQHKKGILILEGFTLGYIQQKEVFYSIIIKIIFGYKIQIIFTENYEHTAAFLIALYKNTFSDVPQNPKLMPPYLSSMARKKQILFCFPNLGKKKAARILTEFSSLRAFFTAPSSLLQQHGIGKKTQEEIEKIIG